MHRVYTTTHPTRNRLATKPSVRTVATTSARPTVIYDLQERVDVSAASRLMRSPKMADLKAKDAPTWAGIAATVDVARHLEGHVTVQYYLDDAQEGYGRMKARVLAEGTSAVLLSFG